MSHLDEGTVHAWLDGALSAEEARRVEAHVAECAPCAALVAEARGLVAAASRIVGALDEADGGRRTAEGAGDGRAVAPTRRRVFVPVAWAAGVLLAATGTYASLKARGGAEASAPSEVASTAASTAASRDVVQGDARAAAETTLAMSVPQAPPPAAPAASAPAATAAAPRPTRRGPADTAASAVAAEGGKRLADADAVAESVAERARLARAEDIADRLAARREARPSAELAEGARRRGAAEMPAPPAAPAAPGAVASAPAPQMAKQLAGGDAMRVVTGTLRTTDGAPLADVQVRVVGTVRGTVTDVDGRFRLELPRSADTVTLRAQRIGYASAVVRVAPADSAAVAVAMRPSTTALEGVTVTGMAAAEESRRPSMTARRLARGDTLCYAVTAGAWTSRGATLDDAPVDLVELEVRPDRTAYPVGPAQGNGVPFEWRAASADAVTATSRDGTTVLRLRERDDGDRLDGEISRRRADGSTARAPVRLQRCDRD